MKVTRKHAAIITAGVRHYNSETLRDIYRTGRFPRAALTKDLDKRYRWDLFWCWITDNREVADEIMPNYNDAHIDTVLRQAIDPLEV